MVLPDRVELLTCVADLGISRAGCPFDPVRVSTESLPEGNIWEKSDSANTR